MKYIKFLLLNCFCIVCLLVITSCGRKLEDIELYSADDICSYMNKIFYEDFELMDHKSIDETDAKYTIAYLKTANLPDYTIWASQGYYDNYEFGWYERKLTNYNYYYYKKDIEAKFKKKFSDWFDGVTYKYVNTTSNIWDEAIKYKTFDEYLKNTYYLEFLIVIQMENENLDDIRIKMTSIKYDLQKENINANIYIFTLADISSLSEEDIKNMNRENALVSLR